MFKYRIKIKLSQKQARCGKGLAAQKSRAKRVHSIITAAQPKCQHSRHRAQSQGYLPLQNEFLSKQQLNRAEAPQLSAEDFMKILQQKTSAGTYRINAKTIHRVYTLLQVQFRVNERAFASSRQSVQGQHKQQNKRPRQYSTAVQHCIRLVSQQQSIIEPHQRQQFPQIQDFIKDKIGVLDENIRKHISQLHQKITALRKTVSMLGRKINSPLAVCAHSRDFCQIKAPFLQQQHSIGVQAIVFPIESRKPVLGMATPLGIYMTISRKKPLGFSVQYELHLQSKLQYRKSGKQTTIKAVPLSDNATQIDEPPRVSIESNTDEIPFRLRRVTKSSSRLSVKETQKKDEKKRFQKLFEQAAQELSTLKYRWINRVGRPQSFKTKKYCGLKKKNGGLFILVYRLAQKIKWAHIFNNQFNFMS